MLKTLTCLVALFLFAACGQKAGPVKATAAKDPKIAAVEDKIQKTTPEGKEMVEKVKAMKPEVNDQAASKTLNEIVDDYAKNKGTYNINLVGWEASKKASNGRWKIVLHYQDWQKNLLAAEWEYNPQSNKLYPFEVTNAPTFWTGVGGDAKTPAPKGTK